MRSLVGNVIEDGRATLIQIHCRSFLLGDIRVISDFSYSNRCFFFGICCPV